MRERAGGVEAAFLEIVVVPDEPPRPAFVRGDSNADGNVNLTDAVFTLNHLFLSGLEPSCLDATDTNDTGKVDLTDAIYTLNHLFLGGPAPEQPFPTCGPDRTDDELACQSFPTCE